MDGGRARGWVGFGLLSWMVGIRFIGFSRLYSGWFCDLVLTRRSDLWGLWVVVVVADNASGLRRNV